MKDRLKAIRNDANLTMRAFADRVGISSSAVAHLETGKNTASEQTIRAICSEFNVNRTWLETGEGDPYQQSVLIPELMRALEGNPALRATLERIVPLMRDEDWKALDALLDRIAKKEP